MDSRKRVRWDLEWIQPTRLIAVLAINNISNSEFGFSVSNNFLASRLGFCRD